MSSSEYPIPQNETERLEALRHFKVLDSDRERSFDEITKLAAFICKTPIAAVTLVDSDRQWFKSSIGLAARESPRNESFCAHAMLGNDVMVVEDATKDERFSANPVVTGDSHIRFYAGAPLVARGDFPIGALCVVDSVPRALSPDERAALTSLSHLVMTQLELRKLTVDLADSLREVKALRDILPTCSYCKNIRNERGEWAHLEDYIMDETVTRFSHGICPECAEKNFPGLDLSGKNRK